MDCGMLLVFGFVGFLAACIKCYIKDTTFGHLFPQVPAKLTTVLNIDNFLCSSFKILDK
jgi:hypothetical protein